MRILMLGAGAIGGFFGARIHAAGGDICFLVREKRAEQIRARGLRIISNDGNSLQVEPKILTQADQHNFDVVMLSCKAYDLQSAVASITPALAPDGIVLPLLNGSAHLPVLDKEFGEDRVLGGIVYCSSTLSPDGDILQLNSLQKMIAGIRHHQTTNTSGKTKSLVDELNKLLSRTTFDFILSDQIEQEMWNKHVFLATLAAATCLMRAPVGLIGKTHIGHRFTLDVLDECALIAQSLGYPQLPEKLEVDRQRLTGTDTNFAASMLRDIERGGPSEGEHIIGDLVSKADEAGIPVPNLSIAYAHLQTYEMERARAAASV